jgi:hypothetical protein
MKNAPRLNAKCAKNQAGRKRKRELQFPDPSPPCPVPSTTEKKKDQRLGSARIFFLPAGY